MKIYNIFFIILIAINHSQCLGITNVEKTDDFYIINIASEDIQMFEKKLADRIDSLKLDFKIIKIKAILTSIILFFLYILFFSKEYFNKFNYFLLFFIFCFAAIYIHHRGKDYLLGIRSAECAFVNFHLALENNIKFDLNKSNNITKLKKVYIGDEIEVYGIQALFCEIPGTLPSNNANPESFTFISGGACYN